MIRAGIVVFALATLGAALWTGARYGYAIGTMVGFLGPHYGYSPYVISAIPFLAPWRGLRWLALGGLLLSQNRASWLGLIAGWVVAGGRRRLALGAILCVLAGVGGAALKPFRAQNDSIRAQIWATSLRAVARQPWRGHGAGGIAYGIRGRAFTKAHSDLLQIAVNWGLLTAGAAVLAVGWGLYMLPAGPWKNLIVCLTAQSVVDNRLHHPVCAALYAAAWLGAALASRRAEPATR